MTADGAALEWKFFKFGVFVTGRCEEGCLPDFQRSLTSAKNCKFEVIRRVGQRSPKTSARRRLRVTGSGKIIPNRDANDIGLPARAYLQKNRDSFVLLIDDLEHDRRGQHADVFDRYRRAFDTILPEPVRCRASVHFLVNMIEAYYFGHADAINAVLGTTLSDFNGDVETIRHPKGEIKAAKPGFDERVDGSEIIKRLDLEKILSNPQTCASLRALFKWCTLAKNEPLSHRFQLLDGVCSPVTGSQ